MVSVSEEGHSYRGKGKDLDGKGRCLGRVNGEVYRTEGRQTHFIEEPMKIWLV